MASLLLVRKPDIHLKWQLYVRLVNATMANANKVCMTLWGLTSKRPIRLGCVLHHEHNCVMRKLPCMWHVYWELWNSLPDKIRSINYYGKFKWDLKTWLFHMFWSMYSNLLLNLICDCCAQAPMISRCWIGAIQIYICMCTGTRRTAEKYRVITNHWKI